MLLQFVGQQMLLYLLDQGCCHVANNSRHSELLAGAAVKQKGQRLPCLKRYLGLYASTYGRAP